MTCTKFRVPYGGANACADCGHTEDGHSTGSCSACELEADSAVDVRYEQGYMDGVADGARVSSQAWAKASFWRRAVAALLPSRSPQLP